MGKKNKTKKEKVNKKPNIFKQLWIMQFHVSKYGELTRVNAWGVIRFIICYNILLFGLFILGVFIRFQVINGGVQGIIQKHVPTFMIENGKLQLYDEYLYESENGFIMVHFNSEIESFSEEDIVYVLNKRIYGVIVLGGSQKTIIYDGDELTEISYSGLPFSNNEELIGYCSDKLDGVRRYFPIFIAVFIVFACVDHAYQALGVVIGIMIISAIRRKKLKRGQKYKTAIYVYAASVTFSILSLLFIPYISLIAAALIHPIAGIIYTISAISGVDAYNKKPNIYYDPNAYAMYKGLANDLSPDEDPFSSVPIGAEKKPVKKNKPQISVGDNLNVKSSLGNNTYNIPDERTEQTANKPQTLYGGGEVISSYTRNENKISGEYDTTEPIEAHKSQLNIINADSNQSLFPINTDSEFQIQKPSNVILRDPPKVSATDSLYGNESTNGFDRGVPRMSMFGEGEVNTSTANDVGLLKYSGSVQNIVSENKEIPKRESGNQENEYILIDEIKYPKLDVDLIDKFIVVGLKDTAVRELEKLINCSEEKAEDIINNWNDYYQK